MFLQLKLDIQIYEEERMTPNLGKCQKIKRLSLHCRPELGWKMSYILHILVFIEKPKLLRKRLVSITRAI